MGTGARERISWAIHQIHTHTHTRGLDAFQIARAGQGLPGHRGAQCVATASAMFFSGRMNCLIGPAILHLAGLGFLRCLSWGADGPWKHIHWISLCFVALAIRKPEGNRRITHHTWIRGFPASWRLWTSHLSACIDCRHEGPTAGTPGTQLSNVVLGSRLVRALRHMVALTFTILFFFVLPGAYWWHTFGRARHEYPQTSCKAIAVFLASGNYDF